MAAVPSLGRATPVEQAEPLEAEATRALYERYARQIFSYCLHQLGSREEAEDAVQSTFLNAFRGLRRGVVPQTEQAWLFKIAHNVCLSRRRSSWRRSRVESPAEFERAEQTAAAPGRRPDELIGLQDALEDMPESQRRAILLREWQGLSYREIAAELELSQPAVETLIFRARRTLAQRLERAPEEVRALRRRVRASLDFGALVGALKSLAAGGAAVKIAGAAAVVAVTAVGVSATAHAPAKHPGWSARVATGSALASALAAAPQSGASSPTVSSAGARVAPKAHATALHRAARHSAPKPTARVVAPVLAATASAAHAAPAASVPDASRPEESPASVGQPRSAKRGNLRQRRSDGNAGTTNRRVGAARSLGRGKEAKSADGAGRTSGRNGNGLGKKQNDAPPASAPAAATPGRDGNARGEKKNDAPVGDPAQSDPQPASGVADDELLGQSGDQKADKQQNQQEQQPAGSGNGNADGNRSGSD